jgi:N-acyl amino acid synthase of PEP-CTERM/exosortase system
MKSLFDYTAFPCLENSLDRYFEVVSVSTPALLDQVYTLRYQVYCIERAFEDRAEYPTGRESDCYDAHSQHVALLYRPSGEMVGTGRLIFPAAAVVPQLPLLSLLEPDAEAAFRHYPIHEMAEVSRYAVAKQFRRRKGEDEFPDTAYLPDDGKNNRRLMPHITLALIRGLLKLGISQQVRYFCACMTPALLRLMSQHGFTFKPIGRLVNHHGFRQPCVASIDDLLLGLKGHSSPY